MAAKKGTIKIKPSREGLFTAKAERANFAHNARAWNHGG